SPPGAAVAPEPGLVPAKVLLAGRFRCGNAPDRYCAVANPATEARPRSRRANVPVAAQAQGAAAAHGSTGGLQGEMPRAHRSRFHIRTPRCRETLTGPFG